MKHGSPTETDLMRLADEQEMNVLVDERGKELLLMHLKEHEENCMLTLGRNEIRYLIRLLEKGE